MADESRQTLDRLIVEPRPRRRRIAVDPGVDLSAWEWSGSGRPFVLVHGLASNALMWQGVAAALHGSGHRVVAVDLRGHGRSGADVARDMSQFTLTQASDDLGPILEVVVGTSGDADAGSSQRPILVGQSWGGNVAMRVAATRRTSIAGVVAVDGGHIDLAERFRTWSACRDALTPQRVARPVHEVEAELRSSLVDWPETGIQGALACYSVDENELASPILAIERHLAILRDLFEHPPGPDLDRVEVPALLIPAGPDPDRHRPDVSRALDRLPDGRLEWVDGHHDLHAQFPLVIADLLVEFARAIDQTHRTQRRTRSDQR